MMNRIEHALRQLARSPWFAITAIGSVALAIGLAGSVVSIVHAAFFTPLPYSDADRLVEIWQTASPSSDQVQDYLQPIRIAQWESAETRHLETIAGSGLGTRLTLARSEGPVGIGTTPILGDWFGVLGVSARKGRVLTPADLRPNSERAAVVSDAFEDAWLEGDGLGSVIDLSGTSFVVVGVMSLDFESRDNVWIAAESFPEDLRPLAYAGVARLRDGASVDEAAVEVGRMAAAQVSADSALFGGMGATARPMGWRARSPDKAMLWLLTGVVAAVILLGLCNLTQIFLVNAQRRTPDLAIRASLGGTPWEIGKDLLVEAGVIGFVGAAAGVGLTYWGKDLLGLFVVGEYVLAKEPVVGWPVWVLALSLASLTSIVIGTEPLRHLGRLDLQAILQARAAGSATTRANRRSRNSMVAVQVAICIVLAASATVVGSAYRTMSQLDVGVDADRVVQAIPDYGVADMDRTAQWQNALRLMERLEQRSEIAEPVSWQLVSASYPPRPEFELITDGPGSALDRDDSLHHFYEVTPGFFSALGVEVVEGRSITRADGPAGPLVAVVTRKAAQVWWPSSDPLGRQVKLGEGGSWMTVVGVVEDLQPLDFLGRGMAARSRTSPQLFVPAVQMESLPPGWRVVRLRGEVALAARASDDTDAATQALQEEIATLAPQLEVLKSGTIHDLQMGGYPGRSVAVSGRLVAVGTAIALLLAILGIVGIVIEGLNRRTREMGVRIALGARAHQVAGVVAKESLVVSAVGLALGLALLVALDSTLSRFVFDYSVKRLGPGVLAPITVGTASALVALVSVGTAVLVASRATRIQPATALRSD